MEDAARLALRVQGTRAGVHLCVHCRARVSSGYCRKVRYAREGGRKEDEAFCPVKAARLDASIKRKSTNNGKPTARPYRSQEVQTDLVEVCCALRYCEECMHSDTGIWTQGVCCSWFASYTAVRRENLVLRRELKEDRAEFDKVDRALDRALLSSVGKIWALKEARAALDLVTKGRGRRDTRAALKQGAWQDPGK